MVLFKVLLTGEAMASGPKNLSKVYKYLTLSLASLAAIVTLPSWMEIRRTELILLKFTEKLPELL